MARNRKARSNKKVQSKKKRVNLTVTAEGKRIYNRAKQHHNMSQLFDRFLKREFGDNFQNLDEEFNFYKKRLGKLYTEKERRIAEIEVEFESKKYAIMKKLDEVSQEINKENPDRELSTDRANKLMEGIREENPEIADQISA